MDIYKIEQSFKDSNPETNVEVVFDSKCVDKYEIRLDNGESLPSVHVEYAKCLVKIDGQHDMYMPIDPHRDVISYEDFRQISSVLSVKKETA